MLPHINVMDNILARSGIAFFSLKLRMYGPKYFWPSSQSYSFGEDLKYRAAESSRKGVVGSRGRNIPTIPNISEMVPMITSNILIRLTMLRFAL